MNVAQKLIHNHLVEGEMIPGQEIGIQIDQTLTQDATGTLVMLELEAMRLDRVRTEVSVQYVDHNLIQVDHRNPDDHIFLESACQRFGIWYSRPGNGVSHPVHMQRFGIPGKTLLGSDSHTPAAGSLGMLAMGAGGIDVAMAMVGAPYFFEMPQVWGVKLLGRLPDWVSAKDIILEMLRRHDVDGGVGMIIEYYGPGLDYLTAMDRHVIANMGTELGATSTVFPSDQHTQRFLEDQHRGDDWVGIQADPEAGYDRYEEIDLATLEPLIALPSSPGNVVPVREVAGEDIYQAYIGSSANPGYRDIAIVGEILKDRKAAEGISLDINPSSRQMLEELMASGVLRHLIHAGARLHQAGCNGCIGMGQAPATGRNSLRTVPRNFPGRSGTKEDRVFLCSPETAAVSALYGGITDPRNAGFPYPEVKYPQKRVVNTGMLSPPLPREDSKNIELIKGPNIASLPTLSPLPDRIELPVLLKVGDDISTDEILPAGARILPYRSNIPKISEYTFEMVDETYVNRARQEVNLSGHAILGGRNYGQGSSREHAALAPRYLGLRVVLAKSFARIHQQNLVNFGVLPVTFVDPQDYDRLEQGDKLLLLDIEDQIKQAYENGGVTLEVSGGRDAEIEVSHSLSKREIEVLLAGGLTNWIREKWD
jgi:aconitate hydratase